MLVLPVLLVAATARAECRSVPACMFNLGVGRLDPKLAAIAGAGAFTALAATALALHMQNLYEKEAPAGVFTFTDEAGRQRLALALVPVPPPVPLATPLDDGALRRAGALRLSDTLTTVGLAAGGAALVASMIAGILAKH
jgi:hypothetical protein